MVKETMTTSRGLSGHEGINPCIVYYYSPTAKVLEATKRDSRFAQKRRRSGGSLHAVKALETPL